EAGAVDIAQPSPTKVGGITEMRKVANLAAAHNVRVVPHTPYFGPGYLAGLQFSSTLDREIPVEWLFVDMETTLYGDAIIPRSGKIQVPAGPGLGIDPDPAVIARCGEQYAPPAGRGLRIVAFSVRWSDVLALLALTVAASLLSPYFFAL